MSSFLIGVVSTTVQGLPCGAGEVTFQGDSMLLSVEDLTCTLSYADVLNLLVRECRICVVVGEGTESAARLTRLCAVSASQERVKLVLTLSDMAVFEEFVIPMLKTFSDDHQQTNDSGSQPYDAPVHREPGPASQNPPPPRVSTISFPIVRSRNVSLPECPAVVMPPDEGPSVAVRETSLHQSVDERSSGNSSSAEDPSSPLPPSHSVVGLACGPCGSINYDFVPVLYAEVMDAWLSTAQEEITEVLTTLLPKHAALVRAHTHRLWLIGWKDIRHVEKIRRAQRLTPATTTNGTVTPLLVHEPPAVRMKAQPKTRCPKRTRDQDFLDPASDTMHRLLDRSMQFRNATTHREFMQAYQQVVPHHLVHPSSTHDGQPSHSNVDAIIARFDDIANRLLAAVDQVHLMLASHRIASAQ